MVKFQLLFDDGTIKYLKAYSYHDIDSIELYIKRHPEILRVEIVLPVEDENYDNN